MWSPTHGTGQVAASSRQLVTDLKNVFTGQHGLQLLVLLDACHSGASAEDGKALGVDVEEPIG
jgi:hypothetical protein